MRCDAMRGDGDQRVPETWVYVSVAVWRTLIPFSRSRRWLAGWLAGWLGGLVLRVVWCSMVSYSMHVRVSRALLGRGFTVYCVLYTAIVLELVCCVTHSISIPRKSTYNHTYVTFSSGETNGWNHALLRSSYQPSSHSSSPPPPLSPLIPPSTPHPTRSARLSASSCTTP
jgi:hypothetical protein